MHISTGKNAAQKAIGDEYLRFTEAEARTMIADRHIEAAFDDDGCIGSEALIAYVENRAALGKDVSDAIYRHLLACEECCHKHYCLLPEGERA